MTLLALLWACVPEPPDRAPVDADGDGVEAAYAGGRDCDDSRGDTHPDAPEVWYDGIDQACDGGDDFDQDADGWKVDTHGGQDCDDTDAAVHPGAADAWYDGADSDCAGNDDDDQDGDGDAAEEAGGDDCDDLDETIHPGAQEAWYDGVDQDCDGGSDDDRDGDGADDVRFGGDDCDDGDAAIHPGADETWYDGVDQDCDGGNDFDADGDGDVALAAGGADCNDVDAAIGTRAPETLGDSVDADCDGDPDTAPFWPVTGFTATGLVGPAAAQAGPGGELVLTFQASELEADRTTWSPALGAIALDPSDPLGVGTLMALEPGSSFSLLGDSAFDGGAVEDVVLWAYDLQSGSAHTLNVTAWDLPTGATWTYTIAKVQADDFDDIELMEGADGDWNAVACDGDNGDLVWVSGDLSELEAGTADVARTVEGDTGYAFGEGDDCFVFPGNDEMETSADGTVRVFFRVGDELQYAESIEWGIEDAATDMRAGATDDYVYALADDQNGGTVSDSAGAPGLDLDDPTQVGLALLDDGRVAVALLDAAGQPWLALGDPGSLDLVQLYGPVEPLDDIDLVVSDDGTLLVAARAGNTLYTAAFVVEAGS